MACPRCMEASSLCRDCEAYLYPQEEPLPTAKKYSLVSEMPRPFYGRCSQILPNRLQCWKAGEVLVEEEVPASTEDSPNGTKTVTYQLCKLHAQVQQTADALAAKAETTGPEESQKHSEDASNLIAAAPPPGTSAVPPNQASTTPPPESNAVETPTGTISSPTAGSFHEQILKTLGEKQQTAMPRGEDSPNNQ